MKYEFKGTKGEWMIDPKTRNESGFIIRTDESFFIGEVGGGKQSKEIEFANAKLIAAAPELLLCLQNLNAAIDNYWNSKTKPDSIIKMITRHQQLSQAAIKKALDFSAVDSSDNSSPDQVDSPGPRVRFKGKGLIGMFLYKYDDGQEYVGMVAGKDLPIVWSIEPNWKNFDEQLDTEQLIRTAWEWENANQYYRVELKTAFPEVYKDFAI